jgi:hypothetical protein
VRQYWKVCALISVSPQSSWVLLCYFWQVKRCKWTECANGTQQMQMDQTVSQEPACATTEFARALQSMILRVYSASWAVAQTATSSGSQLRHVSPLWAFLSGISNEVEVVPILSQLQNCRGQGVSKLLALGMQIRSCWADCHLFVPFWIPAMRLT